MTFDFPILITLIIISYLFGSIPFGLIIAKIVSGKDIRNEGSNNIGATNVARVVGKKYGAITFLLDAAKAIIPIAIIMLIFSDIPQHILYIIGLAAILGHIFPIWLKFSGGKGVATSFAVFFILLPKLGAAIALSWLVTFFITRVSAVAAITSLFIAVILSFIFYDEYVIMFTITIFVIIVVRHISNIKRLILKEEHKF